MPRAKVRLKTPELRFSTLYRGCVMSQPSSPREWQILYAAAMLEADAAQLARRIQETEAVIQARLSELSQMNSIGPEEMKLQSALEYLSLLASLAATA